LPGTTLLPAPATWDRKAVPPKLSRLKRWRYSGETLGLRTAERPRIAMTFPDILLEDDFLVAFDKPSGLPVVRERQDKAGPTLMGIVRERYGPSLANVHRLDAQASGIVLCAKTKAALDFLSGQFQSKTVRKSHQALVVLLPPVEGARAGTRLRDESGGLPAEFSVDLALGEDEHRPGQVRVFHGRGGKPSVTDFRVLESFGRFAWVECRPQTGRMHQVRAHLAAAGAPVLNDALYGDPAAVLLLSELKSRYKGRDEEKPLLSRLALHAVGLGFSHPGTRETVEVCAPLPKDLGIALKYLRRFGVARRPAGGSP
jgi:23S rRNA-/tRNA-specific pseudouridylate synthase